MDPDYQPRTPKHKFREFVMRHKLPVIIVIVVLICGSVGGWIYFSNQKPTAQEKQAQQTKLLNDTADKAQKLAESGKQADAVKVIDNAIKSNDDPKIVGVLLLEKSTTYYNSGDYDKALAFALESEAMDKNSNIEEFIAKIYVKKDDNKNAIKYYQKAIELVDVSEAMGNADILDYQNRITYLSGATK